MTSPPSGLLEFGSNSLKFYSVELSSPNGYSIETRKFPWRVAHDFFSSGRLRKETIQEMFSLIRRIGSHSPALPLSSMLSVATGVFREIPSVDELGTVLRGELGVRLRVISGKDEARLMAKCFRASKPGSFLLCDLGGSTTEWAWIEDGRARGWGSLRLGAIRNLYALRKHQRDATTFARKNAAYCDRELASLPVESASLVVIAGAIRALAELEGTDTIPAERVRATIEETLEKGPPRDVPPARQEVFLSGLAVLDRLAARCQAATLEYGKTSVRDGMAERLVQLLGTHQRKDIHSTLLLLTQDVKDSLDREKKSSGRG